MKQLSSSELNSMSKEDLAAMVLQMQQLHQQLQQQQKQMEQQIHAYFTSTQAVSILNSQEICLSILSSQKQK